MKLSVVVLSAFLAGCAHADYAQLADSATTAVALSNGYAEVNPLFGGPNWPIIAVVKLGVTQVVKQTPTEICEPGLLGLTVSGYGFALWNVGVMAGSGPVALLVALGLAVWQWDNWTKDAKNTCSPGIVGSVVSYEVSDDEYDLLIYK